mgnify:CR=1 FL=1
MGVAVGVRNESARKRVVRRDRLSRLAERICEGESLTGDIEISVLFCDDPAMAELNRQYGEHSGATDVLSFEQPAQAGGGHRLLGDVVISLETAERNCAGDRTSLRNEVDLLFCHGVLHLLGYDHGTARERERMNQKQAEYLGVSTNAAWDFGPKGPGERAGAERGGGRRVGR